jgi:hypothetical protein
MATAQYAGVWNLGPEIGNFGQNKTENKYLAELMKKFGCGNEIAPFDADAAFGRRMGAIIARGVSAARPWVQSQRSAPTPNERAPLLQPNILELRSTTERTSLLNALHNAPRSDRLTMLVTAAASTTLLIAVAAVLSEL